MWAAACPGCLRAPGRIPTAEIRAVASQAGMQVAAGRPGVGDQEGLVEGVTVGCKPPLHSTSEPLFHLGQPAPESP